MQNRRAVLGLGASLIATGAAASGSVASGRPQPHTGAGSDDPVRVISTWDFGAKANAAALARIAQGGSLIDGVETGVQVIEDDPGNHSVGLGGYPDRTGRVTLDAIIMDDAGAMGAVAALEDVVNAITAARLVMERTPHTMLVGPGATEFALSQGMKKADLLTPAARKAWLEWIETSHYQPVANIENQPAGATPGSVLDHDTIGMLARSTDGRMAGGCTTSGMAFKMRGRVGDSPLAGSGLYVERGIGGATATGVGEEVTRIVGTARVVGSMRAGLSPAAACREAVEHIARLRGDAIRGLQVGFIALACDGTVGAFSLLPGFTYAVTRQSGATAVVPAPSLLRA